MTYFQLLRDPRWQRRRLEILNRDNFCCQLCGGSENSLHVHHKAYQKGMMPWEYDGGLLVTLCEDCHFQEEQERARFTQIVRDLLMTGYSYDHLTTMLFGLMPADLTDKALRSEIGALAASNEEARWVVQGIINETRAAFNELVQHGG